LQTLEWVAIGLVILALIGAVALALARPSSGVGEAVTEAIARMFRCLTDVSACIGPASGATPVSIWGAVGECFVHPERCIGRWWTCIRQGTCGPADWIGLLGLLPWMLTPVGVLAVGVRAVPIPWWKRVGDFVNSLLDEAVGFYQTVRDILADRRLSGDPGEGNGSGIPFPKRVFAVFVLTPFLLLVDVSLFLLTLSNTVFLLTFPDPASRILSLSTEIGLIMCDLFLVFVHLQLAHWAITGRWIRSVEDLTDWSLRP
jgi:hypothetical protein